MPYCPECGSETIATAKFCKKCGHDLKAGETQSDKNKPELKKEITHKKAERVESAGGGGGVRGLAVGLICGIVTLISFFVPWCTLSEHSCSTGGIHICGFFDVSISGWTALTTPDNFDSSFPYPYFVLAGAIMMIVFALIAVVIALSTRSKSGKVTFGWLAMMSSLISVVASVWAMFSISNMTRLVGASELVSVDILYGIILCAAFSFIGLIGFAVALAGFNKPEKRVQQHGES